MIILSEHQQVQTSMGHALQLQHSSVGEDMLHLLILVHSDKDSQGFNLDEMQNVKKI